MNASARSIACYVKIKDSDILSLNSEFLKCIGGQSHTFCSAHNMPLIISTDRKMKCSCGRKEHFSCPFLSCTTCICKRCTNEKDIEEIHHIFMPPRNDGIVIEELVVVPMKI